MTTSADPPEVSPQRPLSSARQLLPALALAALVGWFVVHFGVQLWFAVDVPCYDEWEMLRPDALPAGLRIGWLFEQHSEHRIPLTKLLAWIHLKAHGWNFVVQQAVNFLIYGGALALLGHLLRREGLGRLPTLGCLALLLTPLNYENHSWAFQVQHHLALLGHVLMVGALVSEERNARARWLSGLGLVLSLGGSAGGVLTSGCLLGLFVFRTAARYRAGELSKPQARADLGWVVAPICVGLAAFFISWTPSYREYYVSPWSDIVLVLFSKLMGLAFGVRGASPWTGFGFLLVALLPAALAVRRPWERVTWVSMALMLPTLLQLAILAESRAGWLAQVEPPDRYWQQGALLLPACLLALNGLFAARPRTRDRALGVFLACCALSYASTWNFDGYRVLQARKLRGLPAIDRFYATGTPQRCPELYSNFIDARVSLAHELQVSFTRRFPNPPPTPPGARLKIVKAPPATAPPGNGGSAAPSGGGVPRPR